MNATKLVRCLSTFPFSRLDIQCLRNGGHIDHCYAIEGTFGVSLALYEWAKTAPGYAI